MRWNVAEAKQKFSEVIRAAARGPQLIYSRDRLVAAIVSRDAFEEFQDWKDSQRGSLAEAFTELRQICTEEGYSFETPPRRDRPNAFTEALDDAG